MTDWQKQRSERDARLNTRRSRQRLVVPPESAKVLLEAVIRPKGPGSCLEERQPEAGRQTL